MISEQAAFLGPVDMAIVMAVALIVFGPNKLPEVGRQIGQAIRELKKLSSELTESINSETTEIKSAFTSTSPYTLKPGPVDTEAHQSTDPKGYIENNPQPVIDRDAHEETPATTADDAPITGQAAVVHVPLTATVYAKTEDETS